MKFNKIILLVVIIPFFGLFLTACQSRLFTYRGWTARPDIRIELKEGGPHSAVWRTYDLSMEYEYVKIRDMLKISGDIAIGYNWPVIEHFLMRVHFLDRDNQILDSRVVGYGGYRRELYALDFFHRLQVPEGAEAIGFSYDGVLRGHGDDGDWTIWQDPRRSDKYGFFY